MRFFKAPRTVVPAAGVVLAVLTMAAGGASAAPIYLCLSEKAGTAKSGGLEGKCPVPTEKVKYAKVALPSEESEQQKLLAILPYIKYVASGVGGKPTIQISGANIQVISGAGKNETLNGAGNIIIGYNELPETQTGSNNLVLATQGQSYTSWGAVIGGNGNSSSGPGTVVFGAGNRAIAGNATVTGGHGNTASGISASVSGGFGNLAGYQTASVSGGQNNIASFAAASVSGGANNTASETAASVSGGRENTASGLYSAISGGSNNRATGKVASVTGGASNLVEDFEEGSSISGGFKNTISASTSWAAILGGKEIVVNTEYGHYP